MADSISITMKMETNIPTQMKSIISTTQGCSKAFEEFRRRSAELTSQYDALNKRYDSFIQESVSAKTEAEQLKLEMSAMTKAARASGEELDTVSYEKLQAEYQKLTDKAKEFKSAAEDTKKEMKLVAEEARKMSFAEDAGTGGGNSGLSGKLSLAPEGSIWSFLSKSGVGKIGGEALSNLGGAVVSSAFGNAGSTMAGSIGSGIAGGVSGGAMFGPIGAAIGGVIGGASGLINGAAKTLEEKDSAFKDYYRNLYEDAGAATTERLSSGSALAASRETASLPFNTLLGGGEEAGAFLKQLQDAANATTFRYDDLVDISKTMLSAGTAADAIIPTLTKVGDAGAALGLSTGDVGTVAEYLGRMQSGEKASLEYLNPLDERGFSVFQWLADDLNREDGILKDGKSQYEDESGAPREIAAEDVRDLISSGALSGEEVSQVILEQFEKLYAGMMDIQSKSTESLDSRLQGLKENVDAAGGGAYNTLRNESKEADIAAYSGPLGDKLAELSAVTGEVQAYGENLKDQFQREALEAVLLGTLDKENTVFSRGQAADLENLAKQYAEAEKLYNAGDGEENRAAGLAMTNLREEAEALAAAAYESSEWAQKEVEAELDQIAATRELTVAMNSAADAWRKEEAFSIGRIGGFLGKLFGGNEYQVTVDVDPETGVQTYTDSYGQAVDSMLVDPGGAGGWTGASGWTGAGKGRETGGFIWKSHAYGLDYVPYDGFPALLHQGERVLTAAEARAADRGGGGVSVTVTGNAFHVRQDSDVDAIAETLARKLQNAMLRGGG